MHQEVSLKVNPFYHRGDLQTRRNFLEVAMKTSTKQTKTSSDLDAEILEKFGRLTVQQQLAVLEMAIRFKGATPPDIEIATAFVDGLLPGGAA